MGLGDAGSRRGGASTAAVQGFASLALHMDEQSRRDPSIDALANFVFEEIFAIFFPVLDRIFLEMQAGYMEFMAVLDTLRDNKNLFDWRHIFLVMVGHVWHGCKNQQQ